MADVHDGPGLGARESWHRCRLLGPAGHVFNVVNRKGLIVFVDGQGRGYLPLQGITRRPGSSRPCVRVSW